MLTYFSFQFLAVEKTVCQCICSRFFTKGYQAFDSSKISIKPKGKLIIVKKKIPATKDIMTPVEWKEASSIIKKLNWEYSCLYGPVQSSKPIRCSNQKLEESNGIIQHETQIPIIEPSSEKIDLSPESIINKIESLNLDALLNFPLVNKSISPSNCTDEKINEWNFFRKSLEYLCQNSSKPSVSTILEKTMPKERVEILNRWKQNMIKELGEEGFQKYHKELLDNGASLHNSINSYLASTPASELVVKEENLGHWNSLKFIFPNIRDVKLLEEFVTHPFLCYRGVVDCFARYKNHLVVIDWKTSKKTKANIRNTYDNPLQIAAYAGALNFDPKFQYLARNGLIVVAYENGTPASAHFITENSLKDYWNQWLLRVKEFWCMKRSEIINSCK